MARPKIFVSSTYYDLRHIRAVLRDFIMQFGYDPILFEKGEIPFHHQASLEESCLNEVSAADILILIVGGRYGSLSAEDQKLLKDDPEKFFGVVRSVTRKEYESARERDIPIFIFVEEGVLSEYRTYQENRDNKNIKYAHVDDVRIYRMLDDIFVQPRNNYVKGFSNHQEILEWLRQQWAGIFAEALKRQQTDKKLVNLEAQIRDLGNVVSSLKSLSEAIVKSVEKERSREIITKVNQELQVKQLDAFAHERLIEHLRDALDSKLTDEELFSKFIQAKDFETFVESLDIDEGTKQLFKGMRAPKVDFKEMKAKYTLTS